MEYGPATPILPESSASPRSMAKMIAYLMDSYFTVPGTKVKVGLNPLLDLVPGVGDTLAVLISAVTLVMAARVRVPKVTLVRMSLNILLTAVVGVIPVVGEAFAWWYCPSHRNYELLQRHLAAPHQNTVSTRSDWTFVGGLIGGLLAVMIGLVALGLFLTVQIFHFLTGV